MALWVNRPLTLGWSGEIPLNEIGTSWNGVLLNDCECLQVGMYRRSVDLILLFNHHYNSWSFQWLVDSLSMPGISEYTLRHSSRVETASSMLSVESKLMQSLAWQLPSICSLLHRDSEWFAIARQCLNAFMESSRSCFIPLSSNRVDRFTPRFQRVSPLTWGVGQPMRRISLCEWTSSSSSPPQGLLATFCTRTSALANLRRNGIRIRLLVGR